MTSGRRALTSNSRNAGIASPATPGEIAAYRPVSAVSVSSTSMSSGNATANGTRPPGARAMKRLAHELWDPCRVVDLHHPLAQRLEEPPVLDLLECLAIGVSTLDLADEHHHGCRVLRGGMKPDRGVAGARSPRDHDDAGPPGELAVGFRHVGGAAFVPAGDCRDGVLRVVQGVQGREVALARHAEDQCRRRGFAVRRRGRGRRVRRLVRVMSVTRRAGVEGARILAHNARDDWYGTACDCAPIHGGGSMTTAFNQRG